MLSWTLIFHARWLGKGFQLNIIDSVSPAA